MDCDLIVTIMIIMTWHERGVTMRNFRLHIIIYYCGCTTIKINRKSVKNE